MAISLIPAEVCKVNSLRRYEALGIRTFGGNGESNLCGRIALQVFRSLWGSEGDDRRRRRWCVKMRDNCAPHRDAARSNHVDGSKRPNVARLKRPRPRG